MQRLTQASNLDMVETELLDGCFYHDLMPVFSCNVYSDSSWSDNPGQSKLLASEALMKLYV